MTASRSGLLFVRVILIFTKDCCGVLGRAHLFFLLLNVIFDLFRHGNERLFNVDGTLCWGFKEWDFKVSSKFCAFFLGHLTNLFHVTLISDENFANAWVSEAINLYHPLTHVFERISIRNIVHYNDAVCTSVVAASQSTESLLPCSVPNLQFHHLFVKHYGLNFLKRSEKISHLQSRLRLCWKSSR
jgi:hypothetical protein